MQVRAKFQCDSVETVVNGGTVKLHPVTSGSKENEQFFKYTPSGSLVMGIVNLEALKQFEPGKSYYLDFTLAE
jgi:hypothetical protein